MACLCGALARTFRPSTHKLSTITIEESVERKRFRLALDYLTHKHQFNPTGVTANPLEIEDTFEGMQLKWSLRSKKKKYKKFGIIPCRRKIRFLQLSFRRKHRSRVKSEYLYYVRKEARRIRDEEKQLQRERIKTWGSVAAILPAIVGQVLRLTIGI